MILAPLAIASGAVNALRLIDRPEHRRCIGQGRRTLHALRPIHGHGSEVRMLAYLRYVDRYVVEQIVLILMEGAEGLVLRTADTPATAHQRPLFLVGKGVVPMPVARAQAFG